MTTRLTVILLPIFFLIHALPGRAQSCAPSNTTLCLKGGRFSVEVGWTNFSGGTGVGTLVPGSNNDSGLFWFFREDNWEMLVKMVDGCSNNERFWVFAAATTNVAYTLRVTDTLTGTAKEYSNPLGTAAPATTDTQAFATCDGMSDLPPDPGPENDLTIEGIDSDGDGIRDDVQRYIALNFADSSETRAVLTQLAEPLQNALQSASDQNAAFASATSVVRALECLHSTRTDAMEVGVDLVAEVVDTGLRGEEYLSYNDMLGGGSFPIRDPDEWAASCNFTSRADGLIVPLPPDKMGQPCVATEKDTKVYFANGVWNTHDQATQNLLVLTRRLNAALPANEFEELEFELAHNPSQGYILDLWEVFNQVVGPDFPLMLRVLAGHVPVPVQVRATLLGLSLAANAQNVVTQNVLQRHLTGYRADQLEGKRVLVVAHSQGNFFANAAHDQLSSEERASYGIVSVANPDRRVAGTGRYSTLEQDLIIAGVPLSLPSNVSNSTSTTLGHTFGEDYMRLASNSLQKIQNDFRTVRSLVQQPEVSASDGVITVTLTWGAEPDVDLHAFEPNGTHVYYANRIGPSGFLDVDDVSSFGPEHYFVACDTLETGTYEIGVNYFFGFGPETAIVRVEAGLLTRTFQVSLPESLGFGGDADPGRLANILVSGSAEDGFVFDIQ